MYVLGKWALLSEEGRRFTFCCFCFLASCTVKWARFAKFLKRMNGPCAFAVFFSAGKEEEDEEEEEGGRQVRWRIRRWKERKVKLGLTLFDPFFAPRLLRTRFSIDSDLALCVTLRVAVS